MKEILVDETTAACTINSNLCFRQSDPFNASREAKNDEMRDDNAPSVRPDCGALADVVRANSATSDVSRWQ